MLGTITDLSVAQRKPSQSSLISVIMIFRDERRFLAEAIDSVIRQTWQNWELLLVDDGSTDGSSQIAREYATQNPERFRYLSHANHANLGMSVSRNLGLHEARGHYVCFLDGDDVYFPQRLEKHARVLDMWPTINVVQSDLLHWHSWQKSDCDSLQDYVRPRLCATDRLIPPPLLLWAIVTMPQLYPGICSITVRRDTALEDGGFETRFRSLYEDQVFLTKIYARNTVYIIEDYLAAYRIHSDSTVERLRHNQGVVDSTWEIERQHFEYWRLSFLGSLPDPSGCFSRIIGDAEHVASLNDAVTQSRVAAIRRRIRRLLPKVLPQTMYRWLLGRRRTIASRRARMAFAQLCERWIKEFDETQHREYPGAHSDVRS